MKKRLKVAQDRQTAKAKGAQAATLTKLKPIAVEINARLGKADKMTSDAFDHRLAAAIRLEDARKMCVKGGLKFKEWASTNVTLAYETVRKLAAIGAAPKPRIALEDMRVSNKKQMKKARVDKGKVGTRVTKAPITTTPSRTAWEVAEDMVASLGSKDQLTLIEARASLLGRVLITPEDATFLKAAKMPGSVSPIIKALKTAFGGLKPSAKMTFIKWAATEVGATVESTVGNGHDAPIPAKGGIDIPDSMRR